MGCASKRNQHGFTLVEISIVMIIIGLLIGGTFGGMKLIENMQVNRTVQDLKAIESAALTFKDTYGRLPGDIRNPSTRLPNCTVAPCATSGNGDRTLNVASVWTEALSDTSERFTFWHHLQAAGLLAVDVKNTTNMEFGEGQPSLPIGGGYRMAGYSSGLFWAVTTRGHFAFLGGEADGDYYVDSWYATGPQCSSIRSLDSKIDDGQPATGVFFNPYCLSGAYTNPAAAWEPSYAGANSGAVYVFRF
ncbi:MAG: prepilin-type N-terminal cleavage/methylation domain-containing protein [Sphingomonadales bacterium]|jgi:prepilin-type N-terminal cleavage/methylation domain-containing protein|nr:prepilin-type N-terminal cleavage/methylation domain-containing protein [Sphingomonadales bacterium]MBK9268071.1 prepilin-type N-terminal cleavage/methylation domain-containing protein [Sphingomonadales bacterium]